MRPAATVAVLFAACTASAQGNFHATPTGGRSALMGGTGVALGTDGAAPFLNPATLGRIDAVLSVSANLFALEATAVRLPNATTTNAAFNPIPSTLCIFLDLPKAGHATDDQGKQKLGACFGTVERDAFSLVAHADAAPASAMQVQSLARTWSRFVIAPTYAVYLTHDVAFGMSIQALFSSATSVISGSAHGPAPTSYASSLDLTALGLR